MQEWTRGCGGFAAAGWCSCGRHRPQGTRYLQILTKDTATLSYIKTIANILYKRSEILFKFLCSCLCLTWVLIVIALAPKIYLEKIPTLGLNA
jgi:hypothetical protein